jgi:signal transduction histidine kinase
MGLARALRWVEAMGGQIRLESRPGAGTRVTLLLPVG